MDLYEKVKSICTDGARTMISDKNGVVGLMKADIQLRGLLSIHCLSHRLNLCVTDFWDGDKPLKEINQLIYNICKFFMNSRNKFNILKGHEKQILDLELRLIKPIDIRWMSKFTAIKRILLLYPALVKTLSDLSFNNKDLCAAGILIKLKNFRILSHLLILNDIDHIISPLNQIFQKRDLDLEQLEAAFQLTRLKLEDLIDQKKIGNHLQIFLTEVEKMKKYQKIEFTFKDSDVEYVKNRSIDFWKITKNSLEKRLGTIGDFVPLRIFRLENIKKFKTNTNEFRTFGLAEIKRLSIRYGVVENEAIESWCEFKHLVSAYPEKKSEDLYDLALKLPGISAIKMFIEIFLSFSFSSNECERTFSRYSLIKSDLRCALKIDSMDHLLNIGLNGPSFEDFNFLEPIEVWKKLKIRYFITDQIK